MTADEKKYLEISFLVLRIRYLFRGFIFWKNIVKPRYTLKNDWRWSRGEISF